MSNLRETSATPVVALEINKAGHLSRKLMELDRQATLETLCSNLCIREYMWPRWTCPRNRWVPLNSPDRAVARQDRVRWRAL